MKFFLLAFTVVSSLAATISAAVVRYPRPPIYNKSAHFGAKVDNATELYTVSYADYDYVQFSMDAGKTIELRIRRLDQSTIKSYSISPRNLPIKAHVEGNQLVFSFHKPHYLIVKIDNLKEFVVLADPMEQDVPTLGAPDVLNVLDYKADPTGSKLNTGIQDAVAAAGKKPGSTVFVPPGLYLMGNLVLPSKTSLYLAGGAVLRFTGNASDYKTLYTKSDIGPGTWWISTEKGSSDIKIFGRGTIDGNGHTTRANKFMASLVVPAGTSNFALDGVLVRDSSFWAVNVVQVTNASFTNMKVLDRFDVTQDDGIDVNESSHVRVSRAIAIANDDSFSAKTWPLNVGTTVPYPYPPRGSSDIIFDDCVAWTYCFAFKMGEGSYEDQDGITFKNGVVYRAGVGLGINHKYGNASISNILFENIDIEDLSGAPAGQAAWASMYVNNVNQGIGPIKGVTVRNIRARKIGKKQGQFHGASDVATASDFTFHNIKLYNRTTPETTLEALNLDVGKFTANFKVDNS